MDKRSTHNVGVQYTPSRMIKRYDVYIWRLRLVHCSTWECVSKEEQKVASFEVLIAIEKSPGPALFLKRYVSSCSDHIICTSYLMIPLYIISKVFATCFCLVNLKMAHHLIFQTGCALVEPPLKPQIPTHTHTHTHCPSRCICSTVEHMQWNHDIMNVTFRRSGILKPY